MEKCFPARLPSDGRLESDVLVGVLVNRNGGRQKISLEKVSDGTVFQWRLCFSTGV